MDGFAKKSAAFDAVRQRAVDAGEPAPFDACGRPRVTRGGTVAKYANGLHLALDGGRVRVTQRPLPPKPKPPPRAKPPKPPPGD